MTSVSDHESNVTYHIFTKVVYDISGETSDGIKEVSTKLCKYAYEFRGAMSPRKRRTGVTIPSAEADPTDRL